MQSMKVILDNEDPSAGASAVDCEIDDPELLEAKKHLTIRGQPLTLVNVLEGKHKNLSFQEVVDTGKDQKLNRDYFTVTWTLRGYP
jgi:hypothetical protein